MLAPGLQQHTNYDWQSSEVLNVGGFGYVDVHDFNKETCDKALIALVGFLGFSQGLTFFFSEVKK